MVYNLSPFYELLIMLEDRGSLALGEIKSIGVTTSRGVIGKMDAMKIIRRETTNGKTQYLLTDKGYDFLNSILDSIHKPTIHWDGKWRVVNFSLREKDRSKRDKFRRMLEEIGFRAVIGGMWLSPLDLTKEVEDITKKLNLEGH